ncbi:MAG: hypothetical protein Kow00127_02100 [Bacteroidales bacterium]
MLISNAQQIAAYNDNLNHFWVFDAGITEQLEHLEIQDYQVGGYYVAYIDNGSNLKVYHSGKKKVLLTGNPIKYTASDFLLTYSLYEQLNVYDAGEEKVLSTQCDGYLATDSMVAFHNRISQNLQIYYKGRIYTIEDGLIYNPLNSYSMGDNTAVWHRSSTNELKLFYQGEILILDDYADSPVFKAGRDIVAFYDQPDQTFTIFYQGEYYDVETFIPKSFEVGDECCAWIDNMGRLKFFDQGEVL